MRKKMMGGGMMERTAMKKGGKMNAGLKAFLAKKKKSYGWWFYGKEIDVCLEMTMD